MPSPCDVSNPCPRSRNYFGIYNRTFKRNTDWRQFLHRLVDRPRERVWFSHPQWKGGKWATVTSFQKAEKPRHSPIACVLPKLMPLGPGVIPIFQFFHLSRVVFALTTYFQNSRSKQKLLSNHWLFRPPPDVR